MDPQPLRPESETRLGLDQISTRWPLISDPDQFVMRYAPAIHRYLVALIKNPHDAEEVTQDFLLRWLQRDWGHAPAVRGRFRNYLKVAVRNAALNHFRRKQPLKLQDLDLQQLPVPEDEQLAAERDWMAEWRQCMLDRAWQALDNHQRRSPGNLFHTVLRLSADHPEEDSPTLAARAAKVSGRPLTAEAFRKQLSRARRMLAELLVKEVEQTLEGPTSEQVMEELIEIGLMPFVRSYLSDDRLGQSQEPEPE